MRQYQYPWWADGSPTLEAYAQALRERRDDELVAIPPHQHGRLLSVRSLEMADNKTEAVAAALCLIARLRTPSLPDEGDDNAFAAAVASATGVSQPVIRYGPSTGWAATPDLTIGLAARDDIFDEVLVEALAAHHGVNKAAIRREFEVDDRRERLWKLAAADLRGELTKMLNGLVKKAGGGIR